MLVVTGRGWFCPRDQAHLPTLVHAQEELRLNGVGCAYIATQAWREQAAFRAGLGATFPFLSDPGRDFLGANGLVDWTEGEYADVAKPFAFLTLPDPASGALVVRRTWDGWWLAGRPGAHDLREAVRELRQGMPGGRWEDWTGDRVIALRVPQRVWDEGLAPPGTVTRRDLAGVITEFDRAGGSGWIAPEAPGIVQRLYFNFTAVPGEGYRTPARGALVTFDLLEHPGGPAATNVRPRSD